jgi:glutamate synthase domain-containing protein 2
VNNKIKSAPDLEWRIKLYKDWQQNGYGDIIVQANVEDTRLGVQEYAISELGVTTVELKWGQGAKDIGGEVKIKNLQKAQLLKNRGYVVLPNPLEKSSIDAFNNGSFKEFERHSRVGMVTEKDFMSRVKTLRDHGAKHVNLKTGAYRPADLARAVKFASMGEIDLLTVDAAGGGTGMSPWRMMNEWGMPQVEIFSLLQQYCEKLAKKKEYIPPIALAGGFILEDHIFKGLAFGAPFVKLIGMARGHLAAAMVGKTIGSKISGDQLPVYVGRFGRTTDEIFITAPELRHKLGKKFDKMPPGAIGVYTYSERLAQGLRQLMTGARKFTLGHITRDDIAALTKEAAEMSGISYIMDVDKTEVNKILG